MEERPRPNGARSPSASDIRGHHASTTSSTSTSAPCTRRLALPLHFYIILLWVSPVTVHCVCFMGLRPWEEDFETLIYASAVCVCLGQLENGNPVGMWVFSLCILSSPSSPPPPNKTLCFSVIQKNKSLARVYQN